MKELMRDNLRQLIDMIYDEKIGVELEKLGIIDQFINRIEGIEELLNSKKDE